MQKYVFGDFELDLDGFVLRRLGDPVKLERRPFDLLAFLIRQPGRMVPRDEIVAALWPGNVIIDFDSGLNTLVRKLRNALGDSAENPRFIETVPGRGYRFREPVVIVALPEPAKETESQPATQSGPAKLTQRERPRRWSPVALPLAILLTVGAVLLAWRTFDTDQWPKKVAVLPFENLTGGNELSYIVYGLAEDTKRWLGQIDPDRLRVIDSSSRAPVDPAVSITERGRELDVDFAVRCTLRSERTKISLTCPLIRIADGQLMNSFQFDRELTNVLGLQRELGLAIAQQIRLRLSPEVAAAIDRRQTRNPEAYDLYLQGRTEWMRLTPDSMRRALDYFEQAVAMDRDYALAWAGIAFAAITSVRTADAPPVEMKNKAREALRQAERLGNDLVETRYARGYFSLFGDLDREAAAASARSALELDPYNAQAYMLLAMSRMRDDLVDARDMMGRAREFGPMFALVWANSANAALSAGDLEAALEFATQTLVIDDDFWLGHYYLGRVLSELSDQERALEAFTKARLLSGGHSLTFSASVRLLVDLGRIEEAQRLAAVLAAQAERRFVPAYTRAKVHALLGETEAAFGWLQQAVEIRDVNLPDMATDDDLKSLHDDPRFVKLLMGCGCGGQAAEQP